MSLALHSFILLAFLMALLHAALVDYCTEAPLSSVVHCAAVALGIHGLVVIVAAHMPCRLARRALRMRSGHQSRSA